MGAANEDEPGRGSKQHQRKQEHVPDAAAGVPSCAPLDGCAHTVTHRILGREFGEHWESARLVATLGA